MRLVLGGGYLRLPVSCRRGSRVSRTASPRGATAPSARRGHCQNPQRTHRQDNQQLVVQKQNQNAKKTQTIVASANFDRGK